MPVLLIFAIIFLVIVAILLVCRMFAPADYEVTDFRDTKKKRRPKRYLTYSAIGTAAVAAILVFFSSLQFVGTKEEGIETAFGSTAGQLSNGAHFTWPWIQVTEMDAAVQTDSYVGDNCLNVRIANQQTACAHISIQWRIIPQ